MTDRRSSPMKRGAEAPEASLAALGFTDIEAAIYCELLRASPSTGYRLAQAIGKASANTYQALAALTQKGAVLVDDSEAKTYRAVPPDELLSALEKGFTTRRAEAQAALTRIHAPPADDRLYQLKSVAQVYERARAMIARAEEILLFDLFPGPLKALTPDLEAAAARGVTIAGVVYGPRPALTFADLAPAGSSIVAHRWPGQQLSLVVDAREHLETLLSTEGDAVRHGIWSDSAYLACLRHSGLSAEIRLALHFERTEDPFSALSLLNAYPPGLRTLVGPPVEIIPEGDAV